MQIDQKTLNQALRRVFLLRRHHPAEIVLTCVRWYVAYPLSLRQIERGPRLWTGKLMLIYQLVRSNHEAYPPSYLHRRVQS